MLQFLVRQRLTGRIAGDQTLHHFVLVKFNGSGALLEKFLQTRFERVHEVSKGKENRKWLLGQLKAYDSYDMSLLAKQFSVGILVQKVVDVEVEATQTGLEYVILLEAPFFLEQSFKKEQQFC